MTRPDVLRLATVVARELDGWEAVPCRYGTAEWAELHGPAGTMIQLRVSPLWVEARALHDQDPFPLRPWEVSGVRHPTIGFSGTKSPTRMAGELRRRLIPVAQDDDRLLDAAVAAESAARAADDTVFAAAAAVFPSLQWWDYGDGRRRRDLARSHSRGEIDIELRLDPLRYDSHSTLTISRLTRAQLLELIRAAAQLRDRTAPPGPGDDGAHQVALPSPRHAPARESRHGHLQAFAG